MKRGQHKALLRSKQLRKQHGNTGLVGYKHHKVVHQETGVLPGILKLPDNLKNKPNSTKGKIKNRSEVKHSVQ